MIDKNELALLAGVFRTAEDDKRELQLTEDAAIGRLCQLMSDVRDHLGGPADCFCPGRFRDPTGYRNDGTAIAFIEAAVKSALAASK